MWSRLDGKNMTISNCPETGNKIKDSCDFFYMKLRDGLTEARDVIMEGHQTPESCRKAFITWLQTLTSEFGAVISIEVIEEFDDKIAR